MQFDADGEIIIPTDKPMIHTVSCDEKPGIQALSTTGEDLRPTDKNGVVMRDAEYKRLGTLSLLAGIDLLTGIAIPLVSESHKSSNFINLLKKFDAQNYKDTTSVFEKYTIRGIIVRDGKIAMQCSKEGEYKIPGGGMEAGETYVEALAREVKEETGLFIIPEKAVGLGEILEVRKDIFDDTKKFICHSLFYYCEETGEETPIHLTKSEIAKGYYLKWATPQEIYDTNIAMEKDPWIIRDTAFIKMILDGKIAALQGIVTGTRYE